MQDSAITRAELHLELQLAVRIAHLAGNIARETLNEQSVHSKTDSSPVTRMDVECERIITDAIKAEFPEDGILGEEGTDQMGSSGRTWIIDPIDGTRDYVRGTRFWCVLIGLEQKNESILGVAHFPLLDETYWAMEGCGAFMNDQAIKVSATASIDLCSFSCNGLHHPESLPYLTNAMAFAQSGWLVRACGALDACMLAAGKVDVWFNPKVAPWDIAALRIIIKEAGGLFLVLGRSGTTTESVIACTPGLLQVVAKEFGFAP